MAKRILFQSTRTFVYLAIAFLAVPLQTRSHEQRLFTGAFAPVAPRESHHLEAYTTKLDQSFMESLHNSATGDRFNFELPDGTFLSGVIAASNPVPGGGRLIEAALTNTPGGSLNLSIQGSHTSGVLYAPVLDNYIFNSGDDGQTYFAKTDPAAVNHGASATLSEDLLKAHQPISFKTFKPVELQSLAPQLPATTNLVSVVDLLFLFTQEAVEGAGGEDQLNNIMTLALAEANLAFQNSRAGIRVREASRIFVDYEESGILTTNLNRLKDPFDGFLDDIHDFRNEHKADLVCLITENGEAELGGIAFTMEGPPTSLFREFAFSVIKRSSAVGTYTLAHEVGHNLGCQHNRANAVNIAGEVAIGAFDYSYGYSIDLETTVYRSVMAVGEGNRIPFFSNPNIVFLGSPFGVSETDTNNAANNTLTIKNTASIAAGFVPPLTQTIPPEVTITKPEDDILVEIGNDLVIEGSVADSDGSITRLELFRDSTLVDIASADEIVDGQFTLTITDASPGVSQVTVKAFDELGASSLALPINLTVRPYGDSFASPISLTAAQLDLIGTTLGASQEAEEPQHTQNPGSNTVWYSWNAPESGSYRIEFIGDDFIPVPAAYTGDSLTALNPAATTVEFFNTPEFKAVMTIDIVAGTDYRFAVYGFENTEGTFRILSTTTEKPSNDDFADAALLEGVDWAITAQNIGATFEEGEFAHTGNTGGKSVWYRWTPPQAGSIVVTANSSAFRPLMDIYIGPSVADLATLNRSLQFNEIETETGGTVFETVVDTTIEEGTEYFIVVDGFSGRDGFFDLSIRFQEPPTNDLFTNPLVLQGHLISDTYNNNYATRERDEPLHTGNEGGKSVWFSWTSPFDSPAIAKAAAEGFFPLLEVYSPAEGLKDIPILPGRSIQLIVEQNETVLTFDAIADQTYLFAVDGFSNRSGDFSFSVETEKPPSLTGISVPSINADGLFTVSVEGETGAAFIIESSTDLITWSQVSSGNIGNNNAPFAFIDETTATNQTRFFRVRQP